MKRFILILLIVFMSITTTATAADIFFEYIRQAPQSENYGNSDGVKITVIPDNWVVGFWGSAERSRFSLTGQNLDYVNMVGVGVGVSHKFKESPFLIFFDAGWFQPFHSQFGTKLIPADNDGFDRAEIYLNEKYAPIFGVHKFDYYTINMSGNFGAVIGIKYIIKGWVIGMGYRMLEIPLTVEGKSLIDEKYAWCRYEDQKLSGPVFSFGYVW